MKVLVVEFYEGEFDIGKFVFFDIGFGWVEVEFVYFLLVGICW